MSYNSNLPEDLPTDYSGKIRENLRALKEDKIVDAATAVVADSAAKLTTARKISLEGDATGSTSFDGSADAAIQVDVLSADTADTCTGNAATATKLATARTISITGDATGSASFDGSANAAISVDVGNANTVGGYTAAQLLASAGGITASSLGANGYVKFSNGLIIQWGRLVYGSNVFPTPFTTAAYRMVTANRPVWQPTSSDTTTFGMTTTGFYITDLGVGDSWKIAGDYIVIGK